MAKLLRNLQSKGATTHLRAPNPVESPFAAVIWKTLLIAEHTFRRLDALGLLPEIAEGVAYVDGVRVKRRQEAPKKKAAA